MKNLNLDLLLDNGPKLSQEILNFVTKSKLVDRLNEHWNECFVYKQELLESDPESTRISSIINDFCSWFDGQIKPKVMKTIADETGIQLLTVDTKRKIMAMSYTGKDQGLLMDAVASSMGLKKMTKDGDIKKMNNASKVIDKHLHKMNIKKASLQINFTLYLDLESAFWGPELTLYTSSMDPSASAKEKLSMTPEQITAICLHEIGHMFTMIYMMTHFAYLREYNSAIVTKSIGHAKSGNTKALEQTIQDVIKTTKQRNPEKAKYLEGILKKFNVTFADRLEGFLGLLLSIILIGVMIPIYMFILTFELVYIGPLYTLYKGIETSWDKYFLSEDPSATLTTFNRDNLALTERLADEFVASFNYSDHLTTGLNRLIYMSRHTTDSEAKDEINSVGEITRVFRYTAGFILRLHMLVDCVNQGLFSDPAVSYEEISRRRERNLHNMYNVINKAGDLSTKEKDEILEQIDNLRVTLNNPENDIYVWIGKIIAFIYKYPIKVPVHVLSDAGTRKEIQEILFQMESAFNNSFSYHAESLRKIARG